MRRASILLVCLSVVVIVLNAVLLRENADLKQRLESLTLTYYREVALSPNTPVPPLTGHDVSGQVMEIGFGGDFRKTLLFVFSTNCQVCDENWPAWKRILAVLEKGSVRAVTVSLSGIPSEDYVSRFELKRLELIAELDKDDIQAYKFRLTPQTILVDNLGNVQGVWTGRLSGANEQEIKAQLSGGPTQNGLRSSAPGL